MPISGPSSYLPTIETFLAHWAKVNTALGAKGPLVLAGATPGASVSVADLEALRGKLEDARNATTDGSVERSLARETLIALVTRLQRRLVAFNERVRADLPGSAFAAALPEAFSVGDAEGGVRDPLRQMSTLWKKINALAPAPAGVVLPLTLGDTGATLAEFDAEREALRLAYAALSAAEVELSLARGERNVLQDVIYSVLKNYRLKVPTALPAGDALLATLPPLNPAPGHTPSPVPAHGAWDTAAAQAKLTWSASADPNLDHYEVRAVAGDDYVADDESVLATIAPPGPLEFSTGFALSAPGLTAGFKVYVVLKTGNERGSEAIYVTRPAS
jgi:hypothetical protein